MTKVLSYGHGAAPYINKRSAVDLQAAGLQRYASKYTGPQTKEIIIKPGHGRVMMVINGKHFEL
jgi:hypothetical protein